MNVTERQRECWHLLALGMTNKQIARKMHLSAHTVKAHLYRLYPRIGAETRIQAALYYVEAADV